MGKKCENETLIGAKVCAKHRMNEWTEAVDDDKSPIDQNSIFGVL